jgi:hypothetical protein
VNEITSHLFFIYSCFKAMLQAFLSGPFYNMNVALPKDNEPTPPMIMANPNFFPFFANVLSAIDGKHIACSPCTQECHLSCNYQELHFTKLPCSMQLQLTVCLHVGWMGGVQNQADSQAAPTSFIPKVSADCPF